MISIITIVAMLTMALLCVGEVSAAANGAISPGPAPNSGDGVSDGSGLDAPNADGSVLDQHLILATAFQTAAGFN